VGVSVGTVHGRVKKMIDLGVINGTKLSVDYDKLGFDICAFLGIYLRESSLYDSASKALKKIPEVVEAHYTTGVYSIFVKILCKDTDHLRKVLSNEIQKIEGIQRTETFISLHESINRHLMMDALDLDD
jgi:Lrp/AsnC family transcriptional regulator for asnA, asnC and gidA